MAGDEAAIDEMAKYCAQDVRTTEQVYLRLRPYDNPHPRMVMDRALCGLCGGPIQYRGVAYVGVHTYRKYVCMKCGKWGRETKQSGVNLTSILLPELPKEGD